MAERYTNLFSLNKNLYSADVPILICAGILSKDNQTGKVFVQLRMQNIEKSYRDIIAVKIAIKSYDAAGNEIGNTKEAHYLDLTVRRGDEFGQKQAITLDENTTRSFDVVVLEVVYSDRTTWTGENIEWIALGAQKTLEDSLGTEMAEQYRLETFSDAKYELFASNGVWMCTCGALNENSESNCCKCKHNEVNLFTALDHNFLSQKLIARKEQMAEESKHKSNRVKKNIKIVTLLLLGIVILIIGFQVSGNMILQKKAQPIIEAFVGTSWEFGYDTWTISDDYIDVDVPDWNTSGTDETRNWSVIGLKENNDLVMIIDSDGWEWEVIYTQTNGIYEIIDFRCYSDSAYKYLYADRIK